MLVLPTVFLLLAENNRWFPRDFPKTQVNFTRLGLSSLIYLVLLVLRFFFHREEHSPPPFFGPFPWATFFSFREFRVFPSIPGLLFWAPWQYVCSAGEEFWCPLPNAVPPFLRGVPFPRET